MKIASNVFFILVVILFGNLGPSWIVWLLYVAFLAIFTWMQETPNMKGRGYRWWFLAAAILSFLSWPICEMLK